MKRIALGVAALLLARPVAARQCNPHLNRSVPDSRYVNNGNGTVTDKRTSLTWQRCPLGMSWSDAGTPANPIDDRCAAAGAVTFTWQQALQAAAALNAAGGYGGFADWRVPNAKELATLFETACTGPALNDRVFPDTPGAVFFTSTPYIQGTATSTVVHGLDFRLGPSGFDLVGKSTPSYVRLVRG